MVKEDENLSQQIAHQPGQDERQHHLSPRDARRRTVEPEEERIQGKENQQRNKSKKHFIGNIGHPHSGEKIVLPGMVEQGYQFREMGQEPFTTISIFRRLMRWCTITCIRCAILSLPVS